MCIGVSCRGVCSYITPRCFAAASPNIAAPTIPKTTMGSTLSISLQVLPIIVEDGTVVKDEAFIGNIKESTPYGINIGGGTAPDII